MNDYALENKIKVRRFGKVTLMTQVTGFEEPFIVYVRMGSVSVIRDRVGIACMGHPTSPYLSLSTRLSCSIDSGSLLFFP